MHRKSKAAFSLLIAWGLMPLMSVAEVRESYKCKMKPGVTRQQIATTGKAFIEVGRAKGHTDWQLSVLYPMFDSDVSRGTFYWNGTSPTMAALEEWISIWESPANSEAQKMWLEYVEDCGSASLYTAAPVN
ncbi:MAG: hypothetical protein ACI9UU_001082 [Candidatus Azotimanducaceae bacterium]|jgi:hypothetical protein